MRLSIFRLVFLWLACCCLPVSNAANSQESAAKSSESYRSVRGSVYSKRLTRLNDHGYGTKLKLQLSAAVYKYDSIDQVLDPDTRHFQSFGIRPRINFAIPTRWRNITFAPSLELALTRQFDLEKTLLSGAVTAAVRYENKRKESRTVSTASLKYGTRYDEEGLNLDDYLKFSLRARSRHNLNWSIGEHTATVAPFASASYFLDDLELGTAEEIVAEITREYEIGLTFSTLPRMRLWKIKVPEVDISFTFADGVQGFKIRF